MNKPDISRSHINERLVKDKLKSILTVPEQDNDQIDAYVMSDLEFCDELAGIFEAVAAPPKKEAGPSQPPGKDCADERQTDKRRSEARETKKQQRALSGVREWLHHSLAALPSSFVRIERDILVVEPTPAASLRYLSMDYMDDLEIVRDKAFRSRELLCDLLYGALSKEGQALFRDIAERNSRIGLSPQYSIHGDVAIAGAIHELEFLFYEIYSRVENAYRKSRDVPQDIPTPLEWIEPFARCSVESIVRWLTPLVAPQIAEPSRDDKIVQILSNIAANRILLEIACRTEFRENSSQMTVEFLNALNKEGLKEIPFVSSNSDIYNCLQTWFGRNGTLASACGYPELSELETHAAIDAAEQTQSMFLQTRGVFRENQDGFASKRDLLIFALSLVLCKFYDVRARGELTGSGLQYVFPNLQQINEGSKLSPSALEMSMIIYGQIIYANEGWAISGENIGRYADATRLKRAHLQSLIFNIFKRSTAVQLLKISSAIRGDKQLLLFEKSGEFAVSIVSV